MNHLIKYIKNASIKKQKSKKKTKQEKEDQERLFQAYKDHLRHEKINKFGENKFGWKKNKKKNTK